MFKSSTSVITLSLIVGLSTAARADSTRVHWGYGGEADPSVWSELSPEFAACGVGREQSPIDIDTDSVVHAALEPVQLDWQPFTPEVVNNGHTIQVNANGAGGYAELGGRRYELLQYHFHHLSEHTIDGKHGQMEVHFVHKSDRGDLLVVGALIEPGTENQALAELWPLIPAEEGSMSSPLAVDPRNLIPAGLDTYRYAGSLTTPPCSEIVTWQVMVEPITASDEQIAMFAELYPNNHRPVQPLGRRYILTSR